MNKPSLRGRVAVITGASRGLGLGLATEFAAQGISLGLCARSRPVLPKGSKGIAESVDVGDARQVGAFARLVTEQLGRIDLWINNAGVLGPIKPLRDIEPEAFAFHLRTNLLGVMHGTQAYVQILRERGWDGGVLVNISSGAAARAYAGWSAYCAGKAATERFTECVQLEEASSGLRAYAVQPGIVDTAMQEQIRSTSAADFPALDKFLAIKKQGTFNTPAFVARHLLAIAFDPDARPAEVVVRLPSERPVTA
jgi:NAD(P)-dependent dehydrogenase (short-subunit alcohol dehydrogenase family)